MILLEHGRTRATIAPEYGGRILRLELHDGTGWLPVLVAPDDVAIVRDEPLQWGSYVMAPWPGRVAGARFSWDGREYGLSATHGAQALHGRGVYAAWEVLASDPKSCRLGLDPVDGWPFPARIEQHIVLLEDGLRQTVTVESLGGAAFPAGVGWHPWFRRDVCPGSDVRVEVDADEVFETDADLIPTGRLRPVSGDTELRDYPSLEARRLDCCYHAVRGPMRVRWGHIELEVGSSANVQHAVVYTPEYAVCVEPQTCAPDAFNLAARGIKSTGLAVVAPGRPLVAETTWRWRIAP